MKDIDDFSALGGEDLEYLARQQWEGERSGRARTGSPSSVSTTGAGLISRLALG